MHKPLPNYYIRDNLGGFGILFGSQQCEQLISDSDKTEHTRDKYHKKISECNGQKGFVSSIPYWPEYSNRLAPLHNL